MLIFIKYFSLITCSIYSFYKILSIPFSKNVKFHSMLFTLMLSLCSTYVEYYNPYCTIWTIILASFIYFFIFEHIADEVILNSVIIAFGLSYMCFSVSTFIISILIYLFSSSDTYNHTIAQIVTALLQMLLSYLMYLPKRFRNGMPFLTNKLHSINLLSINLISLFLFSILSNIQGSSPIFISFYYVIFLSIIFIYLNWRNGITRTYKEKLLARDIYILAEHLDKLEEEHKKLTDDKDALAKIVHRDNKLVPAMLLSVEAFLTDFPDATPEMKARGQALMADLSRDAESRKGIVTQQDLKCAEKLLDTGILSLDGVLQYIQGKAISKNMVLSVSADSGIAKLAVATMNEKDLKTIASDMLENALIANNHNQGSHIHFVIGFYQKYLAIHVYDSGIPFSKEVLMDFGIKQHTTHKEDGGSGIGLITIFELVRKYRASYIIDEYATRIGPYTKRISIVFDKRRNYILNTSRPEDEINYLRQRTDLTINTEKAH